MTTTRPQLWVYTRKAGLLSRAGHDLEFTTEDIQLRLDGSDVEAVVPLRSLRLVRATSGGRLSEKDRGEIMRNLCDAVLEVGRFPEARFVGTWRGGVLEGTLTLHGATCALRVPLQGGVGEVVLDQRRFGITPFSALMGALRIQPEVRVRLSVPALS